MNAILPAPNSVKGNATKAVECFNSPIIDITGSFIYTPQRVQASRITDIRQTLGNHTDQKLFFIFAAAWLINCGSHPPCAARKQKVIISL